MTSCRPSACSSSCLKLSQRTLNHGRAATATPITIAKAPDEYKTGASTKRHQFKGRAGTGAQPVSTSSAREYCEKCARGRAFFCPRKRDRKSKGMQRHPKTLVRKVRSHKASQHIQPRNDVPKHRGTAPEETPDKTPMSTPSRDAPPSVHVNVKDD